MTSKAIDFATIFHALQAMEQGAFHEQREWTASGKSQRFFLELYMQYREKAKKLRGIETTATLSGRRIDVDSILDMLVHWVEEGDPKTIRGHDRRDHEGFRIKKNNCTVYDPIAGFSHIARLSTRSGDSVWLTMPKKAPKTALDLSSAAFRIMSLKTKGDLMYSGKVVVYVPDVDLDLRPDIRFLIGFQTWNKTKERAPSYVDEAEQKFRFKMNKKGAHVRVETHMGMLIGARIEPIQTLTFDRPFIGWFTQPTVDDLPIAIFYADYDSWEKVEDIEEL